MPPETQSSPPLTPPTKDERDSSLVSRVIEHIKNRREGRDLTTSPWVAYSLSLQEYQELQLELERDESLWGFVQEKLRYDYFSSASRLVIRRPTALHEQYIINIVEEIQAQLISVRDNSADFASKIRSRGPASIKSLDEEYTTHDPDAQFRHLNASFPGVVIEISYSQKRKDLGRLANDYILGSESDIQVVLGLDIEDKTSKVATISVWRPNIITNSVGKKERIAQLIAANHVLRDTNGNPGTGALLLRLRDFAPAALAGADLRDPIILSVRKLCSLLDDAEYAVSFVGRPIGIRANAVASFL
ncbi:uncharacterized protein L3040_009427 [Drepanopeziza brunnea f. sp. 'multigermtubi']|uniref:Uncharacterized protein n=1 Tax=Marssonina brunnea f. sp. multigermtubi (strain MB_m1) TaxID=1072389 RepID=K1WI42_MARBU|nr:uncharacterized protein MBM_09277 [Drepanopeziza brunnea f. sp. 'multigermtubi' MB_m1]EKD12521.1 hypothetical protein MBM_09277 [Drepanopeziza brunnea f. sp. 'multigermtubi' MB_m1]KAJ5032836.1 hypothetical protein L3040_009427 [Drepanopeziza brunnea f. sp. 'multigermtubi']